MSFTYKRKEENCQEIIGEYSVIKMYRDKIFRHLIFRISGCRKQVELQ